MAEGPLGGTEGMSGARAAFDAAMDAETPSRSKAGQERKAPERMTMDELFPRRELDRSEPEGGEKEGPPAAVKRAREEARERGERVIDDETQPRRKRARERAEDEDEPPRQPIEDDDEEGDELPEDDENEPGPDDDEDGPEDDEEEGDDEEGSPDLAAIVEVMIDGQAHEVSLKEAVRGYIRNETFHRRMTELGEGVKALNVKNTELDGARQALVERAEALEAYVKEFMPAEPNWEELYRANPGEAAALERRWKTFQERIASLGQSRAQTQQELAARQMENLANFAQANRVKMVQNHPEWTNEKAWRRDHDSMRRTARAVGYTDQEIEQLYDARAVEVLYKASKYDRLMATKPRPVRNRSGKPTQGNGATPPKGRNVSRAFDRAEKRLSRTGSVRDAAGVFERILDHER